MLINKTRKKHAKHRYRRIPMFISIPLLIGGCASQPKAVKVSEKYSKEQIARGCIKLKKSIDEFKRECSVKKDNFYCKMRDLEQDVYNSKCVSSPEKSKE